MPESPRLRVALSVAAAVLLLAGLVATVAVDGDGNGGDELVAAGDRSSTTVIASDGGDGAAAAGEGDATGATAGTSDGAAGGSTGQSAQKSPGTTARAAAPDTATAAPPAAGEPAPLQPPKAGHYTYEVSVDGETSEASYVVEAASGGAPGETRQVHVLKNADGEMRNHLIWKADAVHLDRTSGSGAQGMSGDCDWQPDVLARKLPLTVGSSWVADSSCSGESPYGPYTINAHFEFKVTGTARMTVGGQAVDVWVIESTQHLDITAQYQGQEVKATQDATSKTWVSGKHGLSVREESQSTAGSPMGQRSTSSTRQLKSLSPA